MAIFETAIQQVTACTSSASLIWDIDNASATTFGPLGAITAGQVLKDVTIENLGPNQVFVGSGAAVTAVTGLAIPAGGQLTIQGYNVTSASTATGDISGICSSGQTATVIVGLASNASVV